jgi:hypothetical protein
MFSVASGNNLKFSGGRNLHDTTFDNMKQGSNYDDFKLLQHHSAPGNHRHVSDEVDCKYRLHAYPSAAFMDRYKTSTRGFVTGVEKQFGKYALCKYILR